MEKISVKKWNFKIICAKWVTYIKLITCRLYCVLVITNQHQQKIHETLYTKEHWKIPH